MIFINFVKVKFKTLKKKILIAESKTDQYLVFNYQALLFTIISEIVLSLYDVIQNSFALLKLKYF